MTRFSFKLPDLGEGTVEAEIGAWLVKPGDRVTEDQIIAEMITEKAAVEVPSPTSGVVVALAGEPGDKIAVGSELIAFDTSTGSAHQDPRSTAMEEVLTDAVVSSSNHQARIEARTADSPAARIHSNDHVMTSPAIRRQAQEAGVDLSQIQGTGPRGRIVQQDFDRVLQQKAAGANGPDSGRDASVTGGSRSAGGSAGAGTNAGTSTSVGAREIASAEEIKVIGLRRTIAQRMSEAHRTIPHFAYVEEVDVTELESLRQHLASQALAAASVGGGAATPTATAGSSAGRAPSLTYLPFILLALAGALKKYPQCNVWYDAEREVLIRHRAVHVGVATQTRDGLKVPVVRDVDGRSLSDLATEISRVTGLARDNTAKRGDLGGSTITVTSLGKIGGVVTTPIINMPEVAIIGVNKAVERPVVMDGKIVIRRMMNLSSSFDHRFVDGFDAASMIQDLKARLEHPATIFFK